VNFEPCGFLVHLRMHLLDQLQEVVGNRRDGRAASSAIAVPLGSGSRTPTVAANRAPPGQSRTSPQRGESRHLTRARRGCERWSALSSEGRVHVLGA
jgi:hypothetical protein